MTNPLLSDMAPFSDCSVHLLYHENDNEIVTSTINNVKRSGSFLTAIWRKKNAFLARKGCHDLPFSWK
jgi:hypothetical protein